MAGWIFRITEPGHGSRDISVADQMTFGRKPGNSCVLRDEASSSRHFIIVDEGGGVLAIEDLGSTNGTRLEGGAVLAKGKRQRLMAGLKFYVGATEIEVLEDPGGDEQTLRGNQLFAKSPAPAVAEPAPSGDDATQQGADLFGGAQSSGSDDVTQQGSNLFAKGPAAAAEPPAAESPAADSGDEATLQGGNLFAPGGAAPAAPAPASPAGDAGGDDATLQGGNLFAAPSSPSGTPPPAGAPPSEPDGGDETLQNMGPMRIDSLPKSMVPTPEAPAGAAPADAAPSEAPATPPPAAGVPGDGQTIGMPGAGNDSTVDEVREPAKPSSGVASDSLGQRRARLVLCYKGVKKTVWIKSKEFTFGRDETVDCALDDPRVSTEHAQIYFNGQQFVLEDLGSKNGTFVGQAKLDRGKTVSLSSMTSLRFASVDALFVEDVGGASSGVEAGASAVLVKKKKISADARRQAIQVAKQDNRTVAEMLLLQTPIEVVDWLTAVEEARVSGGPGLNLKILAVIGGLVLVILALVLWIIFK